MAHHLREVIRGLTGLGGRLTTTERFGSASEDRGPCYFQGLSSSVDARGPWQAWNASMNRQKCGREWSAGMRSNSRGCFFMGCTVQWYDVVLIPLVSDSPPAPATPHLFGVNGQGWCLLSEPSMMNDHHHFRSTHFKFPPLPLHSARKLMLV